MKPPTAVRITSGVDSRKISQRDLDVMNSMIRPHANPDYTLLMRVLGVDYGAKRIGLALSDNTGSLARPWQMVPSPGGPRPAAEAVARVVARLRESDDPDLDRIVVGLPRRLNGDDTDQTPLVRRFVTMLAELRRRVNMDFLAKHASRARKSPSTEALNRHSPGNVGGRAAASVKICQRASGTPAKAVR